jgi:hypothetical protein
MSEHGAVSYELIDDRARAYMKLGDMVTAIARYHTHVDVDETTAARWRQVMGLMREVDTMADDTDATSEDVIDRLKDFSTFKERYPDLAPDALDEYTQEAMLSRTRRILKLGAWAAKTTSVERFVALRILEAREAVNLFEDLASESVAEQPEFTERFMPILRAMGEISTLWDSVTDGRADVGLGRQAVVPDGEYYKKHLGAIGERLKITRGSMTHIKPQYYFAAHVGIRAVNRIKGFKDGIPEYSTLKVISGKVARNKNS